MPPKVSILLPNLNTRPFLEERLDTLVSQTFEDWEMVVSDNYSDDGAYELFCEYAQKDERIKVQQAPRRGMYANWNECARRATGEYVYVATSDDTCTPELLEKMVGALERERKRQQEEAEETEAMIPGAEAHPISPPFSLLPPVHARLLPALPPDIAVCNFDYIDKHGETIEPPLPPAGEFYGDWRFKSHRRSGYVELLVHLLIGTSWTTMTAVVFRRSLLEKTGLWRTDCGALADRFWAYRSALHSDTVVVPATLATWRQHSTQGSAVRKDMRALRRLWRATEETVAACGPWLPAAWKQDAAYREKLLWAERRHYFDQYHLTRTALRHEPRVFLRGCIDAAMLEPGFLLRRLASGLAWDVDCGVGEEEYLRRVMEEWGVEGGT